MLTLHNATVVTPTGSLHGATVTSDETGRISYVGVRRKRAKPAGRSIDLHGMSLLPGFIDVHTHGGHGITFGVACRQAEDLASYSRWVVKWGVTGFLCSLAAPDRDSLLSVVAECVKTLEPGLPGAEGLGIHLEGPFLNPERRGAFATGWLREPALDEAAALLAVGGGWIRMITMAPELPASNEVAALFRSAGVTVALGHTDASFEEAREALQGAWTHVTHTFNAQSHFSHRQPGVVGAVLVSDRVTAELIADQVHVHPGAMRLLKKCLGLERLVLVTDAMAGAGLTDGNYDLVGESVKVSGGVARLSDGTLAGSTATMDRCLRTWIEATGASLEGSTRLVSANPARTLGLLPEMGEITPGKLANLTALDAEHRVRLTVVRGRVVYQDALE